MNISSLQNNPYLENLPAPPSPARSPEKGALAETLPEPEQASKTEGPSGGVTMAASFAQRTGAAAGRSRYIESCFMEFSTLNQLRNSFNSSMASIAKTLKGDDPTAETGGIRKARQNARLMDAMQVSMEELKAEYAARAAEARLPKDENGEPVEKAVEIATGGQSPEDAVAEAEEKAGRSISSLNVSVDIQV